MQSKPLDYIGPLKLLLICGVVLIHCNIAGGGAPYANWGLEFSDFVSGNLALACVPSFFIVSGYLFFRGVDKFTPTLYKSKLKRRVATLLVPYVVWNVICALLFLVKAKLLGGDGLGIITTEGRVDWLRFVEGFWRIREVDDFPFAFAFWFIRNLMCLVVLSPLFYLIGRSRLLTVLVIAVSIIIDKSFFGAEYFVVGACLSLTRFDLRRLRLPWWLLLAVVVVYVMNAAAIFYEVSRDMYLTLRYILVFSGFTFFVNAGLRLTRIESTRIGAVLIGATFWIYAFHQCFCSVVRNGWLAIVGDGEWFAALASYALTFCSLVGISVGVWLLMRRYLPGVLAILTGSR